MNHIIRIFSLTLVRIDFLFVDTYPNTSVNSSVEKRLYF